MSNETPDQARYVEPVVLYKTLEDNDDPFDFRPTPESYEREQLKKLEALEEVLPKEESAPEPAASSTSSETQADPASAVTETTTPETEPKKEEATEPVKETSTPPPASPKKTSAGSDKQPA